MRLRGFTLVELLIVVVILGIIATIVVPTFQEAADDSRRSNLDANIREIRQVLIRYELDHGAYPTPPQHAYEHGGYTVKPETQLLCKTNAAGEIDPNGKYGPYLNGQRVGEAYDAVVLPPNPFVEKYKGREIAGRVTDRIDMGSTWQEAPAGWVYPAAEVTSFKPWMAVEIETQAQ